MTTAQVVQAVLKKDAAARARTWAVAAILTFAFEWSMRSKIAPEHVESFTATFRAYGVAMVSVSVIALVKLTAFIARDPEKLLKDYDVIVKHEPASSEHERRERSP